MWSAFIRHHHVVLRVYLLYLSSKQIPLCCQPPVYSIQHRWTQPGHHDWHSCPACRPLGSWAAEAWPGIQIFSCHHRKYGIASPWGILSPEIQMVAVPLPYLRNCSGLRAILNFRKIHLLWIHILSWNPILPWVLSPMLPIISDSFSFLTTSGVNSSLVSTTVSNSG